MYDSLFEPIKVGSVTIPNRIVRAAHGTHLAFPRQGEVDSPLIAYHVARARGGVGMSTLEATGVHPTCMSAIPLHSDCVIDGYQRLAAAVHAHGMKIFQQVWHGGSTRPNTAGGAPWSASDVPSPSCGLVPVPMTKMMIDEIVSAFATAAGRVKAGGLDGVELHAAHGYLPGQFLSPATNHRHDEYGGSLDNRLRFTREVLTAIRKEVGPDFAVGVRLTADEEVDGGTRPDDAIQFAQLLEPLVDFISVSLGGYYRSYKMLAPMDDPLGYELPKSSLVTRAVEVPTIVTGRIMTLDHASRIVSEGAADMVSMVRALIADPDLVNKSRDGRAAEVRPCIGSSQGCAGGEEGHINCVVNVAAGFEQTIPAEPTVRAETSKRVLIAGGGPAGLEAARTAALRGHEVFLYEMTNRLGGQVAIAASAPNRGDVGAITSYLAEEVNRLGVTVKLRTFVEPDLIDEVKPDVVVVATGSTPRRDGFQISRPAHVLRGVELPHVYSSWDVFGFGGAANVGDAAVVYDDTGGYEAICVTEQLLAKGADVTLVTRHDRIAKTVPGSSMLTLAVATLPARERLMTNPRFRLVTDAYLVEITAREVEIGICLGGPDRRVRCPADTVVIVGYNHQNRELLDALNGDGRSVHIVGDAAGSRTLKEAIRTAAHLARGL